MPLLCIAVGVVLLMSAIAGEAAALAAGCWFQLAGDAPAGLNRRRATGQVETSNAVLGA